MLSLLAFFIPGEKETRREKRRYHFDTIIERLEEMKFVAVAFTLVRLTSGFLFPDSNSGCGCNTCPPQPVCPPLPTCPPVQSCPAPTAQAEETRWKRDVLDEVVKVDANCNSEELRAIIIERTYFALAERFIVERRPYNFRFEEKNSSRVREQPQRK
ncbi:hypothetical protein COOONC_14585, partial [Cooperia oncophora]